MNQATVLNNGAQISEDYLAHALNQFLDTDSLAGFVKACQTPLRPSVRVNRLKCTLDNFKQLAKENNWKLMPIPWCEDGFWIEQEKGHDSQLGNQLAHIQGEFYIQEASSMLPVEALFFARDLTQQAEPYVMDMAAAPGSKTTQIAAKLNNKGLVLANELSASRLKGLHANLIRCGVFNTCMSHLDAQKIGGFLPSFFDFVLLDAPCGGEGTVRKDPKALAHWSIESVNELSVLQKQLIISAYQSLKPGGRLVYSTCTLSKEENHQVANFLLDNSDAKVIRLNQMFEGAERVATYEGYLHVLPQTFDSEGFFVACFEKSESENRSGEMIERKPIFQSPFEKMSRKQAEQISRYYNNHFGLDIHDFGLELRVRQKEAWLFPRVIDSVSPFIKINRAGLKIADVHPNKIRSTHEFAMCFAQTAKKQIVKVNAKQAAAFIRGENLYLEESQIADNGEVILTFQSQVLGIGQNQKGKLKNGLPRDLVKDNFSVFDD